MFRLDIAAWSVPFVSKILIFALSMLVLMEISFRPSIPPSMVTSPASFVVKSSSSSVVSHSSPSDVIYPSSSIVSSPPSSSSIGSSAFPLHLSSPYPPSSSPSPSPSPLSSSSSSASSQSSSPSIIVSSSPSPLDHRLVNSKDSSSNNNESPSPLPTFQSSNTGDGKSGLNSTVVNSPTIFTNTSDEPISRPKTTYDEDELATIGRFIIDKPNYCDTDNGANLDLIVFVNSAVGNFEARQAIRQTWGKFTLERGALLLFVVGRSDNLTLMDKIFQENRENSDILQGSFIDSYYNLTLKTMSMMKWVSDNCDRVKFVLKVDDDMFMNMQILVDFTETRIFSKSIIGHIAKKWKPHRDLRSKWFVPESVYNRTFYPNFATGPCYLISGDAVTPLIQTALKKEVKPFYLEDVFMTGVIAEAANIRRLNYSLMKNVRVKVTPCNFKRFMTSHKHQPQEIIDLWNLVYDNIDKPCEKPAPVKANAPPIKKKPVMKGTKK